MLLYGFFGWMKKRQRDKARDKIESQDDWDTGGIVDFGEGILEAIMVCKFLSSAYFVILSAGR